MNTPAFLQAINNYLLRLFAIANSLLIILVGLSGLEPLTPALSAQCSNRLSYRPVFVSSPYYRNTYSSFALSRYA